MEVFAAGNKYKLVGAASPILVDGVYFVHAYKWNKSKNEYRMDPNTYNVGPHYEEIK